MSSLALLVPVLARPHRVAPLLDSIENSTPHPFAVHFICDPGDAEEIAAIEADGRGQVHIVDGGYAAKINEGVRATTAGLIFTGADDLEFLPGWLDAARAHLRGVVGVNDLLHRHRQHATHFLMTRHYASAPCADGSRGPFFEGYAHWFCDDELIATATRRGVYDYAEDSHVRHLHPMGDGAPDDETYRKGRERRREDRRLFRHREGLWTST